MTVFYADDDVDDRDIFVGLIHEIDPDAKVHLATDGAHAIQLLDRLSEPPDFIFLDYYMPNVNGLDCIKAIRGKKRYDNTPIILYSGTVGDRPINPAEVGAEKILNKGTSLAGLKNDLTYVLGFALE